VLQPLVENSIIHGIEKGSGQGCIEVRVFADADTLYFSVRDDGTGVAADDIQRLLSQPSEDLRGFGISNVNERIQLKFSEKYGIEFHSEPDAGTEVIVRQPRICGGF
jgi:two-component system sensor histidine kinase YesM